MNTMTSVINRQRSRRRLAAVTFLSNISLDGTHNDTNLGRYYHKSRNYVSHNKENQNVPSQTDLKTEKRQNLEEFIPEEEESELKDAFERNKSKEIMPPCDVSIKPPCQKKRPSHYNTSNEKKYFSSSESVGPIIPGLGGRSRNLSGTVSETSATNSNKEVKDMRSDCLDKVKDERLVLVSNNKIPCHIFSCLAFAKFTKPEHSSKDNIRKRHTSGTRPVSGVSVSTDPAHILGITCLEEATEISFADLLVPSRNFVRPKKHFSTSDNADVLTELPADKSTWSHPGIARCFSYDPATHKATAHFVPGSHRIRSLSLSCSKPVLLKSVLEVENEQFFEKSHVLHEQREEKTGTILASSVDSYMPNILDDPELRAGKHRKLLRFPSYLTSITDYTTHFELKRELNDKFKDKFPHINLTLSKLRSLKREMLKIAQQECDIDLLTVAQSYVYFEKMIQKSYVSKQNRKYLAGACLILSAKMNDVKGEVLTNLIEKTEAIFRLSRKEMLSWELATMVALEFGMHVPVWQVNPHFQRLMFES